MENNIEVISNGFFKYKRGRFYAEETPVESIAEKYGTPCYVYSRHSLLSQINKFKAAFKNVDAPLICFSVKANSNLTLLKMMEEQGLGADVVSGGELRKALLAQFPPKKIVFAGVGKKEDEIELGVKEKIYCFNIENEEETDIIEKYAKQHKRTVICNLRLNLDIDVDTHHYIKTSIKETKFGLDLKTASRILRNNKNNRHINIKGFHMHLGSQLKDIQPYVEALDKVNRFCKEIGFKPEIIDLGGGFGIPYSSQDRMDDIGRFGDAIATKIKEMGVKVLILEPGRYIVGNTAVLLSRVLYVKKRQGKNFIITDTGMNDIIRPAFYGGYHSIFPAKKSKKATKQMKADIVGPICETSDYIGKDIDVPADIQKGDILVVGSAGAYCFSMASNYNCRPRPCEVMVKKEKVSVIRKREEYKDLWNKEL